MQFQWRSLYFHMLLFCHFLLYLIINNMSISFFLPLFLLCISFQLCHLQSLHFADNKFQKKLQPPIKGRMTKIVVSWDKPIIKSTMLSSPKPEDQKETAKSKRQKYKRRRKQVKRLEELKKVSWRVPDDDHNKVKGNNGAVFGSDYEHARTHPPSHN